MSTFEDEVFEQPEVIREFISSHTSEIANLAQSIHKNPPRFVLIAARGTSDNAAIYAKYLISGINHIPVGLAMPSLYTLYRSIPDMRGGLVIGISQSGQTPDVMKVLEAAQHQNVPTIAITNSNDSPIAMVADHNISLDVGEEKSVAASKTFTSQVTALAMLVADLSGEQEKITELERLPGFLESALEQRPVIRRIAESYRQKQHLVIVIRGYPYCATHEIALKIKELSYMLAQPYSAADFRHGPIAMLDRGFPVLAIAMRGKGLIDMENMILDICRAGGDLTLMTNVDQFDEQSKQIIRLPADLPDWLSPIVCSIPGQLLALEITTAKGLDPDKPRRLNKVTLTF